MNSVDVLIVEDEEVVRRAANRILMSEGLSVETVGDVETALTLIPEKDYRIVLSDLMLPGASGFDLHQYMANQHPLTPFILMTGYATVENTAKAFEYGVFDVLPKPFDVVELVGSIRRAMRSIDPATRHPASGGTGIAADPGAIPRRYYMGKHSWAEVEPDGTVKIGAAETFHGLLDRLQWVELPDKGNDLRQGTRAVRMLSEHEEVYRVWSPLTGTVLDVNAQLGETPDLVNELPFSDGWLVRILPERLRDELENLTERQWQSPAS